MKRQFLMAVAIVITTMGATAQEKYKWQDPSVPRAERVESLLGMLTPEEKVGLMMNKSISIERLGIPSYNWWSEACHGVRQGGYTVYPQPIGMAAAFSEKLVFDVFSQVSDEARANWNRSDHSVKHVGMGEVYYPGNPELSFWCPNVNIFRDPRWGRGQETCGEDPYLMAVLGVQTVLGMQGNDPKYVKTHACAKHYAVHSGPEPLRHSMNVEPSNRDLWETYLPAFKALVKKANVREVMCAYQRFEGKPCCTSDRLLIDILRNKWGYDGLVVTDCDAINNFFNRGQHETHKDGLTASVDAVLNGTDLECGKVFMSLTQGLEKGLIKESDLDQHLRRTLMGRFELGMFDPADRLPWASMGESVISSEEHDALATQAARESMVLLQNNKVKAKSGQLEPVLPLSKNIRTLAVVGPNADDVGLLNGNYGGTPTRAHQHSLLEGIRAALPGVNIIYDKACERNDDYETVPHLQDFNGGQGVLVEFWNNRTLSGEPAKTGYYKELNFSTFGAWGFAEGVNNDSLSVRVSGKYTATFTGEMKYTISTDNGYTLKVNGAVVEEAQGGGRRGGFRRRVEYKSFPVTQGQTYDIVIEYRRGDGNFAMLRGDICERKLVDFTDLATKVKAADAIIVIGGISPQMEGEGGDKQDIELPSVQQRLVRAMHETGRPVVFVNCSGSAIAFGSVEGQYDALLQAWYPGQGGAKALADVLFGNYSPGGKLPVTFYRSTADLPDFLDYSMKNRTYRYFTGQPQYAFGYGLSYTSFVLGKAKLSAKQMKINGKVTVTVPVTNTGSCQGTETVQVYVKALDDAGAPIKALKGFKKLSLKPGETQKAVITLDSEAFEYYDEAIDELSPRAGRYQILCGTSSLDKDLQVMPFVVK
jgi:beta-glucosidase